MYNDDFYDIKKRNSKGIKEKIIVYLFLGAIVLLVVLCILRLTASAPKIEVGGIENISPPIQKTAKGTEIFKGFEIEKVATFELTGRILATREYNIYKLGYNKIDEISPIDMCIGWGKLSTDKYDDIIKFYEFRDRYVNYYVQDTRILSVKEISNSISNSHLIPKTDEIKKQLLAFKKHDLIKIEGYLVNVYDTTGNFSPWLTSKVRTDTGSGSCEIVFVEKVYKVAPKQ